jgi:hypothetical protein
MKVTGDRTRDIAVMNNDLRLAREALSVGPEVGKTAVTSDNNLTGKAGSGRKEPQP